MGPTGAVQREFCFVPTQTPGKSTDATQRTVRIFAQRHARQQKQWSTSKSSGISKVRTGSKPRKRARRKGNDDSSDSSISPPSGVTVFPLPSPAMTEVHSSEDGDSPKQDESEKRDCCLSCGLRRLPDSSLCSCAVGNILARKELPKINSFVPVRKTLGLTASGVGALEPDCKPLMHTCKYSLQPVWFAN